MLLVSASLKMKNIINKVTKNPKRLTLIRLEPKGNMAAFYSLQLGRGSIKLWKVVYNICVGYWVRDHVERFFEKTNTTMFSPPKGPFFFGGG